MSVRTIYDRETGRIVAVMQIPRRSLGRLLAKYPSARFGVLPGRPPAGEYRVIDGDYVPDDDQRLSVLAEDARARRQQLLVASDWTQVADAPVDAAAWAAYRQALRDISDQPGFPELIDWPDPPRKSPPIMAPNPQMET